MTELQKEKCKRIIHSTAASAGATGAGSGLFGPLTAFAADATILSGLEIAMIIRLGKVFDQEISESIAGSILGAVAGTVVGKGAASVLTFIPIVGAFANSAAAAGTVEAVGWAAAKMLDEKTY